MSVVLKATGLVIHGRLENCDLELSGGELTMLVGPNGAGKTSLLHALASMQHTAGKVSVDEEMLSALSIARRSELLSYVGASRDVTWPLAARDFVALAITGKDAQEKAVAALDTMEATEFAERRIDQLSTGERSRVMLARALANDPRVALLDEPCANLDPKWQLVIIDRLKEIARNGTAVLASVHDLDLAIHHADRVLVIADGRIITDGPPDRALDAETIKRVFAVRRDAQSRWQRI